MVSIIKALITGFISLVLASSTLAKDWRGIVPLQSTRADVGRLLGTATDNSPASSYYNLGNAIAVVWFQVESCESGLGEYGLGWKVPVGTVTTIGVIPKSNYPKKSLIEIGRAKVENANAGFVYYTNESEGLSVEISNGTVTSLTYRPTETQSGLRCTKVRDCCVDVFPKFDEYGNLSFEDEQARLDNYGFQLKARLGRGVIVVYGANRTERKKLMKRAERAKKYLGASKRIEPERLLIVDGGYREVSSIELNIYSIGSDFGDRVYLFPQTDPQDATRKSRTTRSH